MLSGIKSFFTPSGNTIVNNGNIAVSNYPFEPATVYPSATLKAGEIDDISVDSFPPMLRIRNELIFISAKFKTDLKTFAEKNDIPIVKRTWNWDYILEPFLDTTFDETYQRKTMDQLNRAGFSDSEIEALRAEVGEQMIKYNFDTMLWEWQFLGIDDVLRAMRPKLNKKKFREFYWRAMEIQLRGS